MSVAIAKLASGAGHTGRHARWGAVIGSLVAFAAGIFTLVEATAWWAFRVHAGWAGVGLACALGAALTLAFRRQITFEGEGLARQPVYVPGVISTLLVLAAASFTIVEGVAWWAFGIHAGWGGVFISAFVSSLLTLLNTRQIRPVWALEGSVPFIDDLLPRTYTGVLLLSIGSMVVFGVISTGLAIYRLSPTRGFDIFHVLRSIGSGAVFPPAVMVIFYPVSEHVRALISTQALAVVVMFGGAATVVLTVYALFKPP